MMVTVIGRGHSGTRAMSQTLSASGVFMGETVTDSGDLVPAEDMYEACRVMAPHVKWKGALEWGFSALERMEIPEEFTRLVRSYLRSVLESNAEHKGWKLPETTLVFPWIRRMFPDMKYIFWIRDPRDCIIGSHLTDDMTQFGIQYPETTNERLRRAISWKYQHDLVQATKKPAEWIEVRFEDFVLRQKETLKRLEAFLGLPLKQIPVKPEAVGRWKTDTDTHFLDFFEPAMKKYGYELPEPLVPAER